MEISQNGEDIDASENLAEVWGDVVSRNHLAKSIIISVALSASVYQLTFRMLTPLMSTPTIGKTVAMLVGIAGALASGAICARLFPPKRIFVDESISALAWQTRVIEQLERDEGGLGNLADLPTEAVEEMRKSGLYTAFKAGSREREFLRGNLS